MASEPRGSVKNPEQDRRLKEKREAGRTMGTTPVSERRAEDHGHEPAKVREPHESARGIEARGASHERSNESSDLKSREYRDDKGEIHHHTRTYEEQHGKR